MANDRHFPFQDLDVYRAARDLAARVHRAAIRDAELRDQATRAAKSAFLNLCEGLPDDRAAMRRKYFVQADGSLHETVGAVDLAAAIGALEEARAEQIIAVAARVRGMLRGLLRSKRPIAIRKHREESVRPERRGAQRPEVEGRHASQGACFDFAPAARALRSARTAPSDRESRSAV